MNPLGILTIIGGWSMITNEPGWWCFMNHLDNMIRWNSWSSSPAGLPRFRSGMMIMNLAKWLYISLTWIVKGHQLWGWFPYHINHHLWWGRIVRSWWNLPRCWSWHYHVMFIMNVRHGIITWMLIMNYLNQGDLDVHHETVSAEDPQTYVSCRDELIIHVLWCLWCMIVN